MFAEEKKGVVSLDQTASERALEKGGECTGEVDDAEVR